MDLSDNPRVRTVIEFVKELSVATSPVQVYRAFADRYWRLRPVDYLMSLSTKGLRPGEYRVTRQYNVEDVRAGKSVPVIVETWKFRDQLPVHTGGFLGQVIASGLPQILTNLNLRDDPIMGDVLAGMRSCMAMPLFDQGEARYWTIQFRRAEDGFSVTDLEQGMMVGNLAGSINTRLLLVDEIKKLNTALRSQFEEVARVQQALLPSRLPEIPHLDIATSYFPSDQAGGDYYDFFPFPGGRWGILIADVSGHGPAAATVMAMLHAILHCYPGPEFSPDAVMDFANRRLVAANIDGSFVTAFFALYDPADGSMRYARCGHNPPRLARLDAGVTSIDGASSVPLGLFPDDAPVSDAIVLRPGDTLVLYTDGVTEAFSRGREMFGTSRLDGAIARADQADPRKVVQSVHEALFEHTGSMSRADDQTIVVLRYQPAESSSDGPRLVR